MNWRETIRGEIEALTDPTPVKVRLLFKALRTRIRGMPDGDEIAERLKARFGDMRRWDRRDHIAMLRVIYYECLDDEAKAKVAPHSAARAGDPLA